MVADGRRAGETALPAKDKAAVALNLLLAFTTDILTWKSQTLGLQHKLAKTINPHIQFLDFYGVLYSRIAIILPASLCLKDEGRGGI